MLAGSLPPGAPPEWYAELVTALRGAGARVAVDTSDAPLKALVDALSTAAARPHLMKPNGEELASFTGHHADELEADPSAAADGRRDLVAAGVESVLVDTRPARRRTRQRRRRLARHPAADHSRQHRRRRRLQPLRLPPRGRHRTRPRPPTRPRRGLRQCGSGAARDDDPAPRQVQTELVHVTRLDLPSGD